MIESFLPPFAIFIAAGVLILFVPNANIRRGIALAAPVVGFINLLAIPDGRFYHYTFLDFELALVNSDKMAMLFGIIFHLVALVSIIYMIHLKDRLEYAAGFIYAGAALGVIFASDLFTLFIFWELMTVSSTFLVWGRGTERAIMSGFRYMMIHLVGGLVLLIGIVLMARTTGSVTFAHMELGDPYTWFIFFGFGVNCAWPFLHSWLSDAYPEATIAGTVFLSAFTTKTAVYALARGFAGAEPLIWIGVAMAAFPIFYAVIENDLRRVLAYSLINQVGFMVVGIGIGTNLALNGAMAHAFADIMFKALLFMGMGAVMFRTGKINATDLGGLYKYMPWTAGFTIVGAASISAFPLFSAFATKSMIMSAAGHEHMVFVWLVLLFASAGVFHHAGIKIPFFAFYGHDSGLRPKEAPLNMLIAMGALAFGNILIGTFPGILYSLLPFPVEYHPYTPDHVIFQLQLLLFSALAFTLLLRGGIYPPEIRSVNVDSDWFYRIGARKFVWLVDNPVMAFMGWGKRMFFESIPNTLALIARNPMGILMLPFQGEEERRAMKKAIFDDDDAYMCSMPRHWSISASVLLVTIFLCGYLVIFLFI